MKYFLFFMLLSLGSSGTILAQKADKQQIQSTIKQWIAAGDHQNANEAAPMMDATFHVYLNQMFGSEVVTTIDKEGYLALLRDKKLGGSTRTLKIKRISILGNVASVQLEMKSSTMLIKNFVQLAKNKVGNWQIVSDLPCIEKL